jgi:hypothetical protein
LSRELTREDRLYLRSLLIIERKANGFYTPILMHLALRHYADAMISLSYYWETLGKPWQLGSSSNLLFRSVRLGNSRAAQHLAMNAFNAGDLRLYRYWLRRAALMGDEDACAALRKFETRLLHENARSIRRLRPHRRSELKQS